MNNSEEIVRKKYESRGWKTLRGGAPDFVFLKVSDDGEIEDYEFVEVKSNGSNLSYEQAVYKKLLEKLGLKYKIAVVDEDKKIHL